MPNAIEACVASPPHNSTQHDFRVFWVNREGLCFTQSLGVPAALPSYYAVATNQHFRQEGRCVWRGTGKYKVTLSRAPITSSRLETEPVWWLRGRWRQRDKHAYE